MKGRVYEVEAWTNTPRESFNADHKHTIQTYPILAGHACNTEGAPPDHGDCGDGVIVKGHQCQPGRVAFISELVMAKVNSRALDVPPASPPETSMISPPTPQPPPPP